MENSLYLILQKFSRNILYTIFDFLCTETVFLSLSLINKLFYSKVKDYIKVAHTLKVKDTNFSNIPFFPHINNLTLIAGNHTNKVLISFPSTLESLKIYGQLVHCIQYPCNLRSLKISKNSLNWEIVENNLILPSFSSNILKFLKINCPKFNEQLIQSSNYENFEELSFKTPQISMDVIRVNKNLKKLGLFKIFSENIEEKLMVISQLKKLEELRIESRVVLSTISFNSCLSNLVNLRNLKLVGNLTLNDIILLIHPRLENLLKLRLEIVIKNETLNQIESLLGNLFEKCKIIESFKIMIRGLGENVSAVKDFIIQQSLVHPTLYKFNGIPIKMLQLNKAASIKIYEDLLISSLPYTVYSCITSCILSHFLKQTFYLYELRIKPVNGDVINIYIPKICERIERLGFFSDAQYFFKCPLYAFPIIFKILSNRPELKYLKIQSLNNQILEIIPNCIYLEKYDGYISTELINRMAQLSYLKHLIISINKAKGCNNEVFDLSIVTLSCLQSLTIKNLKIDILDETVLNFESRLTDLEFNNVEIKNAIILNKFFIRLVNLRKLTLSIKVLDQVNFHYLILDFHKLQYLEIFKVHLITRELNVNFHMHCTASIKDSVKKLHNLREFSFFAGENYSSNILNVYFELVTFIKKNHKNITSLYGQNPIYLTYEVFSKLTLI